MSFILQQNTKQGFLGVCKRGRTGDRLTWKQHWQQGLKTIPVKQFSPYRDVYHTHTYMSMYSSLKHGLTGNIYRPSTSHTHTLIHTLLLAVIRVQCVFLSSVIHQSDGCQWVSVSQTATANQSSIYLLFVSQPSAVAPAISPRYLQTLCMGDFFWFLPLPVWVNE